MLANQSACLSAQLEDGEAGCIVYIERRSQEVVQALVQSIPVIRPQLTIQNLRALYLAAVGYESVDKLRVRHFQREESHRNALVGSNILSHREGKRCLTHSRSSGNNHQVGRLPAGGKVVQLVIAGRDTGETILIGCCLLDDVYGILDDGVYLGIVLFHVALSQLEQRALGLLHQVVYIHRLVEGFGLDDTRIGDELTGQRLLGNDARMVFDIG